MKISLKCWSSQPTHPWGEYLSSLVLSTQVQYKTTFAAAVVVLSAFDGFSNFLRLSLNSNSFCFLIKSKKKKKIVMASSSLSTGTPSASAFSKNSSSLVHYYRNGTVFFRLSSSKPKLRFFAKVTNSFCNCFYFFTKNFVNFTEMKLNLDFFLSFIIHVLYIII